LCLAATAFANTVIVDTNGLKDYTSIQSAINDANDGDIILVNPGIYTGNGNRDIDYLGKAITIRSIDPNNPDIVAQTIIDCQGTEQEPHRGFYLNSNEGSNSILDGLTIMDGWASGGGGIICGESSPIIRNCIIENNIGYAGGGGIICGYDTKIINCVFQNNNFLMMPLTGGGGGAINCSGSNPIITDCKFYGNDNTIVSWWSSPEISNCLFQDNYHGCIGNGFGDVNIANCNFINNSGTIVSGGDSVSIKDCKFTNNSSENDLGAIVTYGSEINIENCLFVANTGKSNYRGVIYIYYKYGYQTEALVKNCTFSMNKAANGKAIVFDSYNLCNLKVMNSIFNDGEDEIWNNDNSTISVVYSNIDGGWLGLGNISVDPCFVNPGHWDPNGTLGDPNDDFWVDGDYHLKSKGWRWDVIRHRWDYDNVTSLCIDAGNPGCSLGDEFLSVHDDPNNEWGENLRIDMGAYGGTNEASIPPHNWSVLSDLTNDGIVDFKDFAYQSNDWFRTGENLSGDLNRDSIIDFSDILSFSEDWLETTNWFIF
jgi:hypothetical protein